MEFLQHVSVDNHHPVVHSPLQWSLVPDKYVAPVDNEHLVYLDVGTARFDDAIDKEVFKRLVKLILDKAVDPAQVKVDVQISHQDDVWYVAATAHVEVKE